MILNVIYTRNRGQEDYFKLSKLLNEYYNSHKITQEKLAEKFGLGDQRRVSMILPIYKKLNQFYEKIHGIVYFKNSHLEELAHCRDEYLLEKLIDNLIYRLSALGWTQSDIATKLNIDQTTVSKIMKNANFGKIHNDYENGKPISEIAEYYGLDIPMVWSILLKDVGDLERFDRFWLEEEEDYIYIELEWFLEHFKGRTIFPPHTKSGQAIFLSPIGSIRLLSRASKKIWWCN